MHLADTILIRDKDNEVLTNIISKKITEVGYFFN